MGIFAPFPRVILVEDEPLLRMNLAEEFQSAGWNVVEATSGEEALSLCQRRVIDAAVIDIRLAGNMDGWELASVMRAVGHDGPVVFVSGSPVDRGRMLPGDIFHAKPVNPAELIRATARMLRGSAAAA